MNQSRGYRMIDGKAFMLNGTVSGFSPEEAKAKALEAAQEICAKGRAARIVKTSSVNYKIYQF